MGRSPRAKFCSDACRAARRRGAPEAPDLGADGDAPTPTGGRQASAVLAELEAAGRAGSALGVAALALAERVDRGAAESGQAFAALVKALSETLSKALAEAEASGDGVDEIRERRERKMARARG